MRILSRDEWVNPKTALFLWARHGFDLYESPEFGVYAPIIARDRITGRQWSTGEYSVSDAFFAIDHHE